MYYINNYISLFRIFIMYYIFFLNFMMCVLCVCACVCVCVCVTVSVCTHMRLCVCDEMSVSLYLCKRSDSLSTINNLLLLLLYLFSGYIMYYSKNFMNMIYLFSGYIMY